MKTCSFTSTTICCLEFYYIICHVVFSRKLNSHRQQNIVCSICLAFDFLMKTNPNYNTRPYSKLLLQDHNHSQSEQKNVAVEFGLENSSVWRGNSSVNLFDIEEQVSLLPSSLEIVIAVFVSSFLPEHARKGTCCI
jgi:hypothetical protein